MAFGLETAQRQYDAQYPENELPDVLTCSVCGYDEPLKNTYTADGEIMCEGCFDDFCAEMYDEHGADFFEEHKEEYAWLWFNQLDSSKQREIAREAFESYINKVSSWLEKACLDENIKFFCTSHGDWKDYIKRVECVEENKE